jgi:hypothetical protein
MNIREEDADRRVAVPLFGSWRNAYVVVVIVFVLDVVLFYALGRFFS